MHDQSVDKSIETKQGYLVKYISRTVMCVIDIAFIIPSKNNFHPKNVFRTVVHKMPAITGLDFKDCPLAWHR